MSQTRKLIDCVKGYSIMEAKVLDANGVIICSWIEVYAPNGAWMGNFLNEIAARDFIDSELNSDSKSSPS